MHTGLAGAIEGGIALIIVILIAEYINQKFLK